MCFHVNINYVYFKATKVEKKKSTFQGMKNTGEFCRVKNTNFFFEEIERLLKVVLNLF